MSAVIAFSGVAIPGWLRNHGGLPRRTGGVICGAPQFLVILVARAVAVHLGAGYPLTGFLAGSAVMLVASALRSLSAMAGATGVALFCFTMLHIILQTRIPKTEAIRPLVAPPRF